MGRVGAARPDLFCLTIPAERKNMKKTDADQLFKRARLQLSKTSGGGHLGGTNHGQGYDAKTTSGAKSAKGKGKK